MSDQAKRRRWQRWGRWALVLLVVWLFREQLVGLATALAWPAAVMMLVYGLRDRLDKLFDRLKAVEAGGVRFDFTGELDKIQRSAEEIGYRMGAGTEHEAEAESEVDR